MTTRLPKGAVNNSKLAIERANRVQRFIEGACVHTKSRWKGQKFILADWQRDEIVRPVFGTLRFDDQLDTWVRQFLIAWIEVARKNGKSELMAAIGLYLLIADDEEGAEIYGCASDREQAGAVYRVAKRMCELSPVLKRLVDRRELLVIDSRKRIVYAPTDSFYQVVAADAAGNLGSNPSGVLFDEVLTQPNRELWDAFISAEGTRDQMLLVAATTAGNDRTSFCYDQHEYGLSVAENPDLDGSRYVYIRTLTEDKDWRDERNWYDANPALGDFLNLNTLRTAYNRAINGPDLSEQTMFRQFRCNQWQRQANRWLDMAVWDDNLTAQGLFDEDQCIGLDGYGGLDLGETDDITAFVMTFATEPDSEGSQTVYTVSRFWMPRAAVDKKHKNIKEFLATWEVQGLLKVTEGSVVDYEVIKADILADLEKFNVREIGYDPWNALGVVQHIESHTDTTCIKVSQTTTRMNAPSKELVRLLGRRELAHNGNPILRWMADNVEVQKDSEGNIKPSKNKSPEKIDGVTALVNSLFCAIREREEISPPAFYTIRVCPQCNADDSVDLFDEDTEIYRCVRCSWTGSLT